MTIFVIPSSYPNKVNPQASIFVLERCRALSKLGHKIVVLDSGCFSLQHWNDSSCDRIEETVDDFSSVYALHVKMVMRSMFPRMGAYLCERNVRRLFDYAQKKHGRPDVIYAHFSYPTGRVAVKLGEEKHIPVVVEEHGGMYMKEKLSHYYKKNLINTIRHSTEFNAVSQEQRAAIYRWAGSDCSINVIPNLVHDRFSYAEPEKHEDMIFFSAGNLKPSKRFDLLVKSFITAFEDGSKVQLRIAGAGEEQQKLQQIITEAGREDQIVLLGRLSREAMLSEYKSCDCFALFSEHESFGIVYREAMAVGRPIVAVENGGIREGWEDFMGEIVTPGDQDACVKVLRRMAKECYNYPRELISQTIHARYASSAIARQINDVLERAVAKNEE